MVTIGVIGDYQDNLVLNEIINLMDIVSDRALVLKTTEDYKKYSNFDNKQYYDIMLANINDKNIELINFSPEIVVFVSSSELPLNWKKILINKNTYVVLNTEDKKILKHLIGQTARIISFGFNQKASVTASSIQEIDNETTMQYCIQRGFNTLNNEEMEPQELSIRFASNKKSNVLCELAAITSAIIAGIGIKNSV